MGYSAAMVDREDLRRLGQPADLAEYNLRFMREIPFHHRTGIEIMEVSQGRALMKLPYSPELVGNPDTGVLHGGIVTALLDACSGLAVFMNVERLMAIATLELRIDYLRPATRGEAVMADAECYRMTPHVAFARAEAFHAAPDFFGSSADASSHAPTRRAGGIGASSRDDRKLIATCTGTFMLGTKPGKQDRD